MSDVSQAIDALRLALHKKGVERHVQDAFNHLASCLVLLNSSSPSVQMINRLRSVLRQPLLPLYCACLQPTLELSSSLLSVVLDKLCDAYANSEESLREAWDATAEVILSGVLDFLEQTDDSHVESQPTAWEKLCRIICDFFFSVSSHGLPTPSIPLSLSAFNTLTEVSLRQPAIQTVLRDKALLGGERLGAAIARTKEYLLAEALLTLFARLLPPIHNTAQGKFQRIKFVKAVLGSPKLFKCSAELVDIVEKTSGILWDDVASKIIDTLARNDINYPQPFPIDEIDVCGCVFLQPLASDKLIMDKHAFLVNVVTENDEPCECLQVPYTHVRTVTIDSSQETLPPRKSLITLDLTSPPLVADNEMKSLCNGYLYAKFLLQNDVMDRFMEALRRRGVGKVTLASPPTKTVKPSRSISLGSGVKFGDNVSSLAPTSSFEDKVQLVKQVYKTNVEDLTTSEGLLAPHSEKEKAMSLEDLESITLPVTPGQNRTVMMLKSEQSVPTRLPPLDIVGKSPTVAEAPVDRDACSDISEFEPEINTSKKRATTSVSATRKCDPKAEQSAAKRQRIGGLDRKSKGSTMGKKKSPLFTSKPEVPALEKPLPVSDPPELDWSSSTRVDVSPHPLQGYSIIESSREALAESIITNEGLTKRTSLQDRSPALKIAGSRRKRESKPTALETEPSSPPHKRIRRARMEDNHTVEERSAPLDLVPHAVVPRARRYSRKKVNEPPPVADSMRLGSRDPPEAPKRARASTRRSLRIKQQTTATSGTQTQATRGKIKKGKAEGAQSSPTVDGSALDVVSLPDSGDQLSPGKAPVNTSAPILTRMIVNPIRVGDIIETTLGYRREVKTSVVENITPINHVAQESQDCNIRAHEVSHPSAKPLKAPWEGFVQSPPSSVPQTQNRNGFQIEAAESTKNGHLAPDLSPITGDVNLPGNFVEYSVSLKGSEDSSESPRPMESTPRKEVVTIDLTLDDSPIQQKKKLREVSTVSEHSDTDIRVSPGQVQLTPTRQVVKEHRALTLSPQRKRRSVTFASPVQYVLDDELESEPRVITSNSVIPSVHTGSPLSTGRLLSPENGVLSPLIIPAAPPNVKHEPFDQVLPWEIPSKPKPLNGDKRLPYTVSYNFNSPKTVVRTKPMSPRASTEGDMQDIVDVLNDIQAAITKGVSNRFQKVRKDLCKGQDELVQQVLDELQHMAIDNAKYFNRLVGLEEAYHENAKAITRCWEDLIDCNESILVHFRDALKEHDQNAHSLLPKSLSALKPVFCDRLDV